MLLILPHVHKAFAFFTVKTGVANPDNGAGNDMAFDRYTLSPSVSLKAGENIIGFEILDSEDTGGVGTATAKGPIFDCLEIGGASCEIGWRPRVANTK